MASPMGRQTHAPLGFWKPASRVVFVAESSSRELLRTRELSPAAGEKTRMGGGTDALTR